MEPQRVLADRYALVSHLARGGMADIFVADDLRLERRVAVKVMHGQYAASDAFVARFRREAQAAGNLSHPNVVSIYDWGEDGGVYFMVMELVEGRDLRSVLKSDGPLLPQRVAQIARDVAAALGAAHDVGLVHRDTKPANILITRDGTVKVTDFGIARAWDDTEQLTRTGAVMGTATYFSPEQAQGLTCDGRSDLYSLGVVMYELLTGRPPFVGDSPVSVAYQHVQQEPAPPSSFDPAVPPALEAIVMRLLEKDPAHRYQTADALAADLRTYLAGMPTAAQVDREAATRAVPGLAPTAMPSEPKPGREAAAAAAYGSAPPPLSGGGYPEDTYDPPGGIDRTTLILGILGGLAVLGIGIILLLQLLAPGDDAGPVTVPDVTGMDRAGAIETLQSLDLRTTETQIADADAAPGTVVRTDPAAGESVPADSTIEVFVSSGPGEVSVPRVIELTEEEGRAALEDAGLEVGEVTLESSPVIDEGVIISQDPAPGEMLAAGGTVDLVVSAGDAGIEVPDVTNRLERDALFQLSRDGFTADQIRIERRPDAEILEGFVIETDPPAGEIVAEDGFVTVYVSEGAVPTVVPDLTGAEPQDAKDQLEELGFVVEFGEPVEVEFDDLLDGLVVEQEPEAGVVADYGSTVTLKIGQAPGPVAVPDLIGLTEEQARTAVESEGLVLVLGDDIEVSADDARDGRVIEQDPSTGELAPGSEITVRIGVARVSVPDVLGLTEAQARQEIEAAGLVFQRGEDLVEGVPAGDPFDGLVGQQSPPVNQEVAPGTTVIVRIVNAPVEVPDVEGRSIAEAQSLIEGAGLRFVVDPTPLLLPPGDPRDGDVADQSPDPGTAVAKGTTVTVFQGEAGVFIPNVLDLTEADAQDEITDAGLQYVMAGCTNNSTKIGLITRIVGEGNSDVYTDATDPADVFVFRGTEIRLFIGKDAGDTCPY